MNNAHVAPLREKIVLIWSRFLKQQTDLEASFFEQDVSIQAIHVFLRNLSKKYGFRLSIRDLRSYPTLDELAQLIAARLAGKEAPAPRKQEPQPSHVPTNPKVLKTGPLSFSEERMWFLDRMSPEATAYNMPFAFDIQGLLIPHFLEETYNQLCQRHECLRTYFRLIEDAPERVVVEHVPQAISLIDLSGLSVALAEQTTRNLENQEYTRHFKFSQCPPTVFSLVQQNQRQFTILWNMHHIIGDGWSNGVLGREMAEIYKGLVFEKEVSLPNAIDYSTYALQQRQDTDTFEEARNYWHKTLDGMPLSLDLPTDFERPAQQQYEAGLLTAAIDRETEEQLNKILRNQSVTPFMFFFAAWQWFLARYSHQWDFAVATAVANRNSRQYANTVGLFVNTLALRFVGKPDQTVRQYLSAVVKQTLEGLYHQHFPFDQLVNLLQAERVPGRMPVSQVDYSFVPEELGQVGLVGAKHQAARIPDEVAAKFELNLSVKQEGQGFKLGICYAQSLWREETAEVMLAAYQRLVSAMVRDLDAPMGDCTLWHVETLVQNLPTPALVTQRLGQVAASMGTQTALRFEGQSMSYTLFSEQAHQLAGSLREHGVCVGDVVGVCLPRSPELFVAMYGIFLAGAVYLPLSQKLPSDRMGFILEDANARLLITKDKLSVPIPCVDPFGNSSTRPLPQIAGGTVAYLIYTSGTTGKPKGVCITHDALAHLAQSMSKHYAMTSADRVLQMCSSSFDISIEEAVTTLGNGATLVLFDESMINDMDAMNALMAQEEVSVINAPTAWWKAWLGQLALDGMEPPKSQRLMIVGGEATESATLKAWHALAGDRITWVNAYGPTETTITATWFCQPKGEALHPETAHQVPIGKVIDGMAAYVLDRDMLVLPPGARGELYLGGRGVALGYLGRPARTASAFLPNPFATEPGQRLYRTGDLCSLRLVGEQTGLVFGGRTDHQVKIRGYRIEIGEVETALRHISEVSDAVVVVHHKEGMPILAGYVCSSSENAPGKTSWYTYLKEALLQELPSYMVPARLMRLEKIPTTTNGKVDQRALAAMEDTQQPECSFAPPETETEKVVASLFEDILGLSAIDRNTDFFTSGGHSLLAVRLIGGIKKSFQQSLPLAVLFRHPTVASLAAVLDDQSISDEPLQLMSQGEGPPVVLIHPIGGTLLCYNALISRNKHREIWGLRAPGIGEGEEPVTCPHALLKHHLDTLAPLTTKGPVHLAGWSMGGVLALELARRLCAEDKKIDGVTLIDSYEPAYVREQLGMPTELQRVGLFAQELGSLGAPIDHTRFEEYTAKQFLRHLIGQVCAAHPHISQPYLMRLFHTFEANMQAFDKLSCEIFPHQVTFFQGTNPTSGLHALKSWQTLLPKVQLFEAEGDHYQVVQSAPATFQTHSGQPAY